MIDSLSPSTILLLLLSMAFQVAGLVLLPVTRGFTAPLATLGSGAALVMGLGLLARMLPRQNDRACSRPWPCGPA